MRSGGRPYEYLNLRRNPFGELTPEERAEVAVVDCGRWEDRLRRSPFALQILGLCGRGKTTHLLALRARFPEACYIHVFEGEKPRIPEAARLFLDDIDQLTARKRGKLFRNSRTLVFTTHVDLSTEMDRAGLPNRTVEVGGCSEEHLLQILGRRIEHARRGPGPVPVVDRAAARRLLERFGDDLRGLESHLYEVFQEMRSIDNVPV